MFLDGWLGFLLFGWCEVVVFFGGGGGEWGSGRGSLD